MVEEKIAQASITAKSVIKTAQINSEFINKLAINYAAQLDNIDLTEGWIYDNNLCVWIYRGK